MKISQLKKLAFTLTSCLVLNAALSSTTYAADDTTSTADQSAAVSNGYLKRIADSTDSIKLTVNNILTQVNNLPTYISNMLGYSINMTQYDDSTDTASMQQQFALTGQSVVNDYNAQYSTFLGQATGNQPTVSLDTTMFKGATQGDIPQAPTLFYSTLLNSPVQLPPKPNADGTPGTPEVPIANPGLSYMLNASGYSLFHKSPGSFVAKSTQGQEDLQRYGGYFTTIVPIQSYNTFVMSKLYAESKSNQALSKAQMQLVKQASDSNWMAKVSASEIGIVLRQLLMFQSQNYVLMTQMLKTQKELVTLQAMNNALLIANNAVNEKQLVTNALS